MTRRIHLPTALTAALLATSALAAQTFSSHGYATYQTGLIPEDLFVADLDSNGSADLAVGNSNAGESGTPDSVSVFLNQGNGIFAPRHDFVVGDRPEGISSGLFDANSSPDLATANFNSGTVSILLNNGVGDFTAGGTIQVAGGPRGITAGDFDGDGKVDLATANYSGNTISLLRGNGVGGFTVLGSTSVGRGPEVIAKGFINDDGELDLVTCNTTDDTLTVLVGNGNGTFNVLTTLPVGDNPRHVKLVDLNSDNFDDILSANHNDGTVTVLRNQAGASFTTQGTLSIAGMSGTIYLNTADLNADGRLDVLVNHAQSDKLGIFPGQESFAFGAGELLPTGDNPLGIGVADLDANGRIDVLVTNARDDNLHVYLSSSTSLPIVLDNGQPGTSFTGSWSTSSAPNPYGSNSVFAKSTAGTVYTWNVPLPSTSVYAVYAWWTSSSNRATAVPYTVTHAGGQTTLTVDQTRDGGQWNFLGTFAHETMTARVDLASTSAALATSADAICLLRLPQGNAPPNARIDSITPDPANFGAAVAFAGSGFDPNGAVSSFQWRSNRDGVLSNAASFSTSTLTVGTHTITLRAQDNQGLWSPEVRSTLEVQSAGPVHTVVVDNGDPRTSFTGSWTPSGAPNPFGANSLYAKNGATYAYTVPLAAAGTYEVYAWWTQLSSRPANAPIDITHAGGTSTVNVNQQTNGGKWNLLGSFSFDSTAIVRINAIGTASTCADAICLSRTGGANTPPTAQITTISPNPATAGAAVSFAGSGLDPDGSVVGYAWRSSLDGPLSTLASFTTSSLSVGSHTIYFLVRDAGGVASAEVSTTLAVTSTGNPATVVLDNGDPGTAFTGSWSPSGGSNPYGAGSLFAKNGATYTYTLSLPSPGNYAVNLWWTTTSGRSTSVPVAIEHAGGTTTSYVNQQLNGGKWNSLGTHAFGTAATIRITAAGSASTCADAVSLVAATANDIIVDNGDAGTSRNGTWSSSGGPNPYGSGSLYARNGPTYTYTVPASGTYRVHAWWTQLSTRSLAVPITIEHAGGSTTVEVNQRTLGGQWNLLGTYSFPGQAVITITAQGPDSTCADAVRLEPAG